MRLVIAVVLVVALGCQRGDEGEAAVRLLDAPPAAPAGVERVVGPLEPTADAEPDPEVVRLGPAPTDELPASTTSTSTTSTTSTTLAPTANPVTTTTTVAPPSTTAPPTTTVAAAPLDPGLPDGAWDAAVAGTTAGAQTSQTAATGLQVGPGQTYATISSAVAAASPGSTIVIHDNGDAYRESFSNDDGWLGKPLRFVAAAGERPVVSGADLVVDWTADGAHWFHQYDDDRFEFALPTDGNIIAEQLTASSPEAGLLEQVVVDGQPLEQRSALAELTPGSFYVDRDADRIYLADDPTGRTVEVTSRHRALMLAAGASGSSIEGLTISGFAPRHLDGKAMVVLDAATDVVLRDVVLTRSSATGLVAVNADRLVLERVTMEANGARGMSGDRIDDLVISRSRFEGNNTEAFDWSACGGGTYCVLAGAKLTRSHGVEVSFSDFSDNRSSGFWCDLDCSDLVFVGNHAVGNARHGAYFEVSEGAVIEANILAANGDAGVKTSGSRDVRIAHNTFVANGAHVNIGADYRPGSIGFHTTPESHMRNIDVVDNVFAESVSRVPVIDPVNHDTAPGPWARLGTVEGNVYLLADGEAGSTWRFRLADGSFELDPAAAVSPATVATGDPMVHFDGGGLSDLRLVSGVAAIAADPLSATAAGFFPALGPIPAGAPLG